MVQMEPADALGKMEVIMDVEFWETCAADYDPDELMERLMNFDSDSNYDVGLVGAAIMRIRALEERISYSESCALERDTLS